MSKTQHTRAGWLVGALGVCLLVVGTARADVSTDRPGSLLIFPKVVNDGSRSTVIQVTNTSNSTALARCYYLAGQPGPTGAPLCSETDFDLALTRQQPTHWNVASGRTALQGGGLGPAFVPPVPVGFTGALICVQVDAGGDPVSGNALKGEATFFSATASSSDTSKYNGIAVASQSNNGDRTLSLNNTEYNACPGGTRVNFVNPGAVDPGAASLGNWGVCSVGGDACSGSPCNGTGTCASGTCSVGGALCDVGSACPPGEGTCEPVAYVTTSVTVLPCNIDLNALVPTTVNLTLRGTDSEEETFSGARTVTCWDNFILDLPVISRPGTDFATVTIVGQPSPVLAVVEALHTDSAFNFSSAAVNTHIESGICDQGLNVGRACSLASDCPISGGGSGNCVPPTATIKLPAF